MPKNAVDRIPVGRVDHIDPVAFRTAADRIDQAAFRTAVVRIDRAAFHTAVDRTGRVAFRTVVDRIQVRRIGREELRIPERRTVEGTVRILARRGP